MTSQRASGAGWSFARELADYLEIPPLDRRGQTPAYPNPQWDKWGPNLYNRDPWTGLPTNDPSTKRWWGV